jgi:hypothetical protein
MMDVVDSLCMRRGGASRNLLITIAQITRNLGWKVLTWLRHLTGSSCHRWSMQERQVIQKTILRRIV